MRRQLLTTSWSACASGTSSSVFGYPGDGINGLLGASGAGPTTSRAFIQARHEEMAAFEAVGYAKFSGRARRVHGDLGPGRDPPAQRPLRRQARPRAGRGDRRPDQPQRHGRLLPAGGRPAQPVQGRRQRLRADGHRPRAAAQRARPGHPHRRVPQRAPPRSSSRPTCRSWTTPRRRTPSRWCPPASASTWPTAAPERRGRPPRRRGPQRRREGRRPGRAGRAGRPHGGRARWPTCSGPGWPRRCSARTSCPTTCRT